MIRGGFLSIFLFINVLIGVIGSIFLLSVVGYGELRVLGTATALATIASAIWWLIDNHLWRRSWARRFLKIDTPDLRGRWEGTIDRHGENNPHDFIMEISQSFSALSVRTYSAKSKGSSIVTKLTKDGDDPDYYLYVIWRTSAQNRDDPAAYDDFLGCSKITIGTGPTGERILEDDYFTGRQPQTKGNLQLRWKSPDLRRRFE